MSKLSKQLVPVGVSFKTAVLAGNQLITNTSNPPTVAVPTLGTLALTGCAPGDVIRLFCDGSMFSSDPAHATGAFVSRFKVDATPLQQDVCNISSFANGTAYLVSFGQMFIATAASHTVTLLASSLNAQYTIYAGLRISALNFGQ